MLFKNGYKINQKFGENAEYYKKFGLKGHEGLDVIPTDSDWNVLCVEGGEVVRDIDDPRKGGAYGNYVVILNRENRRAWWYCHNLKNNVKIGQNVNAGEAIAVMGATGNANGAHVHLGLRLADGFGVATDTQNGYMGFIDPTLALAGLAEGSEHDPCDGRIKELEKKIERLKLDVDDLQKNLDVSKKVSAELAKDLEEAQKKTTLQPNYAEWKTVLWRFGRTFVGTFLVTFLTFLQTSEITKLNRIFLFSLVISSASAGLAATSKAVREWIGQEDFTKLIYKMPF